MKTNLKSKQHPQRRADSASVAQWLEANTRRRLGGVREKNTPSSTALIGQTLHGPLHSGTGYGLFTYPGVRPERFSAMQRPRSLARLLTPQASEFAEELIEIMTGQTAGGTTNATGWCGDPPEAGVLKTCQQVYKFGKYLIKTSLNAMPEIGKLRSRADVPAVILNDGPSANPLIPEVLFNLQDPRSQLGYELFRVGADLERTLEQVLIQGVVGANNSRTGWWSEFAGLDSLIKTGYTDAVTSTTCPAADSAVETWGSDIGSTVSGRTFVEAATDLYYGLRDRARGVGMEAASLVFVMRPETFRAVVDTWACSYATYRCTGTANNDVNRDGMAVQQLRVEMNQGLYLLVDGETVPVVLSEGIPQTTLSNNTYEADIYVVPIDWNGTPLLRLEYFNMGNPYAIEYGSFVDSEVVTTMNNGMFLVGYRSTGLCIEHHIAAQMRLILETPFLAGRLDNVQYTFRAPVRSSYPGTSFYADGGVTLRS